MTGVIPLYDWVMNLVTSSAGWSLPRSVPAARWCGSAEQHCEPGEMRAVFKPWFFRKKKWLAGLQMVDLHNIDYISCYIYIYYTYIIYIEVAEESWSFSFILLQILLANRKVLDVKVDSYRWADVASGEGQPPECQMACWCILFIFGPWFVEHWIVAWKIVALAEAARTRWVPFSPIEWKFKQCPIWLTAVSRPQREVQSETPELPEVLPSVYLW